MIDAGFFGGGRRDACRSDPVNATRLVGFYGASHVSCDKAPQGRVRFGLELATWQAGRLPLRYKERDNLRQSLSFLIPAYIFTVFLLPGTGDHVKAGYS